MANLADVRQRMAAEGVTRIDLRVTDLPGRWHHFSVPAARLTEECFHSLEAPVLRVGGFDTPYPPSRLVEEWLPDLDRVLDAVDRSMEF